MSAQRTYRLESFLPWDGDYAARHLEKMARRGWRLEKVGTIFWTYRRAEPAALHYALTYFPAASVFDSGPTGDQMTYADYCGAAGWKKVSTYGPLQIFVNERPDPVPIETDEGEKLTAIHGAMKKMLLLPYGALAAVWLLNLLLRLNLTSYYTVLSTLSSTGALCYLLAILLLVIYPLWMIGDYLVWYRRSRRAAEQGGHCLRVHTRPRLALQWSLVAAVLALLLVPLAETRVPWVPYVLALLGGVALLLGSAALLLRLLRAHGGSRGENRAIYIVGAVVLSLVYAAAINRLIAPLLPQREAPAPAEIYTVETEWGQRNYSIYRDDLPLTLEDLGYTVTEADHCSYRREEQASPLLRWVQYEQYPCGEGTRLPDLSYDTADVPWGWLRAWCWDRLSRYYGEGGFTETDPAPWEADLALQWEGTTGERRYLLLYGERIVFLYLGEAPTAAQRAVIVEALRG